MKEVTRWMPLLCAAAGREARRAPRCYRRQDREDLTAEAGLIFAEAVRDYKRWRGSFERHLKFRLRRLKDRNRREARRNRLLKRDWEYDLEAVPAPDMPDPFTDLSADAARLLALAAKSDPDMPPEEIRAQLRVYFHLTGWAEERYDSAFREVQEVLR